MPTQPPLPPLLLPYVSSLSPSSLTLISSVLGATGNWLVLRFLYAALSASSGPNTDLKSRKVVLISFLRGWDFWRTEAKRLGLDLARLTDKGQFAFVDGLSELFCTPTSPAAVSYPTTSSPRSGPIPSRTPLPIRPQPSPVPTRAPQPVPAASNINQSRGPTEAGPVKRLHFSGGGNAALDALEKDVISVIDQLKSSSPAMNRDHEEDGESGILLIVDQPDLLLAATGPGKGIGATEMNDWMMNLQQHAYSTILTLSADSPLIHNASTFGSQQGTPLETENAAFVVGSAHRARTVMQLRNLETGAASDVSGVLRVSKGGAWEESDKISSEGNWEEKEVLYFVQRDGGLRVFGRGE